MRSFPWSLKSGPRCYAMPDPYLPALEPDIDLELLPLDKQAFDFSFSAKKAVMLSRPDSHHITHAAPPPSVARHY